MEDVVVLSSDSDEDDSDVEIIGFSRPRTEAKPLPLSTVKIDVDALDVNVPKGYINLTNPKWSLPDLKINFKTSTTSAPAIVDLTENDTASVTQDEASNLPQDDCQILDSKDTMQKNHTLNGHNCNSVKSSPSVPNALQGCLNEKKEQRCLKRATRENPCLPDVELKRLPLLETHASKLKKSGNGVFLTEECTQKSLSLSNPGVTRETLECRNNPRTKSALNGLHAELTLDESPPRTSPGEKEQLLFGDGFTSRPLNVEISRCVQSLTDSPFTETREAPSFGATDVVNTDIPVPSPPLSSPSNDTAHDPLQSKATTSSPERLISDKADAPPSHNSDHLPLHSPSAGLNMSESTGLKGLPQEDRTSQDLMDPADPEPTSEDTCEWQTAEANADDASDTFDPPEEQYLSVPSTEDMDSGSWRSQYGQDEGMSSPVSFPWGEETDGDQVDTESRFETDFREASREDRRYVCPVALSGVMVRPAQVLMHEAKTDNCGPPMMLCRQSLSLVRSTIEENYPEGTLQLLSDLLQPGFYPPKDISLHLLRGILLDPQCPYHLCVQAFTLLMRTQRHHMAEKSTVPWDWELLSSCMASEDHLSGHRIEAVRMLLEYVVQTLEDDFRARCSSSALQHSIAKATLSCDQQFPKIRDVIKWLLSAIRKSTETEESREAARKRDEQMRIVFTLQRMLSLALEVDRSPTLTSAKLSQELFHMLIGNVSLRAHRMLLLECLQSKLLRCKLLEHLLDYACPLKISLPMSLSLLLHFLKNCTLESDPTDTERWKRWEELVHLLWMLLLSYNKTMKGYLCSSVGEQRDRGGSLVFKKEDLITKAAVCDAVETFLSRSQADIGQALPLHVEETLTYLQDYLLDVCQC